MLQRKFRPLPCVTCSQGGEWTAIRLYSKCTKESRRSTSAKKRMLLLQEVRVLENAASNCFSVVVYSLPQCANTGVLTHFHVVVVQWRQNKVQKSVMQVQSCCFANLLLLLFRRSRCCLRCCCLGPVYMEMGDPSRWGNPLWRGNPPFHIISYFNLITFTS